jgi:hypothetical protein
MDFIKIALKEVIKIADKHISEGELKEVNKVITSLKK